MPRCALARLRSNTTYSLEESPLWGAETSGPPFITVTGRIVDDRTGQVVNGAKVIPGQRQPVGSPPPASGNFLKRLVDAFMSKPRTNTGRVLLALADEQIASNGTFCVEFAPFSSLRLLRVEAAGYLPVETRSFAESTNVVIRLKPGAGPVGIVLRADGRPATGATAVYMTGSAMVSVQNRELRVSGEDRTHQLIGPDGKFAFEPASQPGTVVVADRSGWAEAKVSRPDEVLKLRLRPWAAVRGTLISTNGTPAAGMVLALMWRQPSDGGTVLQEMGRFTTDTNGAFEFQNVPPCRVELQRIGVRPGTRWGQRIQQTWLVAAPGVTNDMGKLVCDPPPSPFETLKRKLGL